MEFFATNIEFLRTSNNLKQSEIQSRLDIDRTTWSNYENKKSFPKLELFHKIASYFGVSESDLLNVDLSNTNILLKGKDEKKQDNTNKNTNIYTNNLVNSSVSVPTVAYGNNMTPKVITMDTQGNENVVFVPIKARAGYLNGYGDEEFIGTLPAYRLPGINNGTFRLFEVDGLSMDGTLSSGDIAISSFVESFDNIKDGRVYVIVTMNDGVVVKRVLNRIKTDGKLILKSDNIKHKSEYPNLVISPDDILEMWYVVWYMSRYLKEPSEIYTRINDLEARLTLTEEKLKKQLP